MLYCCHVQFSHKKIVSSGFTLIEVVAAMGVFLLFAVGTYSSIVAATRVAYASRLKIAETAALNEQLEIAKNVTYNDVGIAGGVPAGVLPYQQTVTRNGVTYQITTTVRNIDDPYDGTIASTTKKDTAPADYKLIEMSIACISCQDQTPIVLSTRVPPKALEGASTNGSLFINVFDAQGLPVPGAAVHVVNYIPNPDLFIDDVTDNQGYLRLIDVPTGTLNYNISIIKDGYSSDSTATSSGQNPHPNKLPSTIASQNVTEISFAIDKLGSATMHTVAGNCQALPAIPFMVRGQKNIGTNPTVYKYAKALVTNGAGQLGLPNLEWDTYTFSNSSTAYDSAGTIPLSPLALAPGSAQDVTLVLAPHTANSLLVKVKDAGTGLPLSEATVQLTKTGYSGQRSTSLGYVRQTDWSGGAGQANWSDSKKYWSDSASLNVTGSPGDVSLAKIGMNYATSGYLESSTLDIGSGITYRNVVFDPYTAPPQSGADSIRLQLATSPTSTPAVWNFIGPDGTAASYYTPTSTVIYSGHAGDRYVRYRLYLSTQNSVYTPQISELAFTYTSDCTPPGQAFFPGLSGATYTLGITRSGYTTANTSISVSGATEATVSMSAN